MLETEIMVIYNLIINVMLNRKLIIFVVITIKNRIV